MAAHKQIVKPRTWVTDGAGWCHRMARAVFDAPWVGGLSSATAAADATKYRHTSRKMPNVAVPVWFWHYGTYGGVTGEFGHVVIWVPGRGFLTSPWYLSHGQEWYSTLEEVERTFKAKYRFWSEDINGLRVAEKQLEPIPFGGTKTMFMIHTDAYMKDENRAGYRWAIVGPGFWQEIYSKEEAHAARKALGVPDMIKVDGPRYRSYRAASQAAVPSKAAV